jgi:hypothetical protein
MLGNVNAHALQEFMIEVLDVTGFELVVGEDERVFKD